MSNQIDFARRVCPVCGADNCRKLFTDRNRREGLEIEATLVECDVCTMRYLNPAPTQATLVRLYSKGFIDPVPAELGDYGSSGGVFRTCLRSVNGAFRGHPHDWPQEAGDGRSILDFGCHWASKLTFWAKRGWKVAGIDVNKGAIDAARRRLPEGEFWCGDLLELEIHRQFDIVRSDNVLEHLLEPQRYLERLRSLLKPSGKLRIFVPNGRSFSMSVCGKYSYANWVPFHLNLFSRPALHRVLENSGFVDVGIRSFTPIGSLVHTQKQLFLKPGYAVGTPSFTHRLLDRLMLANYPLESLTQWFGWGEELVATAIAPDERC